MRQPYILNTQTSQLYAKPLETIMHFCKGMQTMWMCAFPKRSKNSCQTSWLSSIYANVCLLSSRQLRSSLGWGRWGSRPTATPKQGLHSGASNELSEGPRLARHNQCTDSSWGSWDTKLEGLHMLPGRPETRRRGLALAHGKNTLLGFTFLKRLVLFHFTLSRGVRLR